MDLGLNHQNTTFFEHLGINYMNDGGDSEVVSLESGEESFFPNHNFGYAGGYNPHYKVDSFEANGASLLFASEEGNGRMFYYEKDDYKVISSSILLGAIASGDSLNLKPYLVAEMINYFLDYDPNVSVTNSLRDVFSLRNSPNPFTTKTRIDFYLQNTNRVSIEVYNSQGQSIKQLLSKQLTTGNHTTTWDATNSQGKRVKAGLYFCKIKVGKQIQTEKMIVIH